MQANKYEVRGRVKSLQKNMHECMILKSRTKTKGQNCYDFFELFLLFTCVSLMLHEAVL